jgi:hypothetical protein
VVQEIEGPKQTIFDPRDPSIKLGIKWKKSWVGSKCHVVETAEKGKINFLTDMIHQRSNEDDSRIHKRVEECNERHRTNLYITHYFSAQSSIATPKTLLTSWMAEKRGEQLTHSRRSNLFSKHCGTEHRIYQRGNVETREDRLEQVTLWQPLCLARSCS